MNLLRKSLYPLSLIYAIATRVRNAAYDAQWLKQKQYEVPTIVVGNLITGGSGKTPMIAYLIDHFSSHFSLAVLSRGYKRKSSGFVLANQDSSMKSLGDETYLLSQKFPMTHFGVCKNRLKGVEQLLSKFPNIDGVLLDDGYQHRQLKPSFQILLTPYYNPWFRDCVLPTGNLRESAKGKNRADVVVVTKCPSNLSKIDQDEHTHQLQLDAHQDIFFSTIVYDSYVFGASRMELKSFVKNPFVLVTGIANPKPLTDYLESLGADFEHLAFADHHFFTSSDFKKILSKQRPILTTEKDYVRLSPMIKMVFFIPISICFLSDEDRFKSIIANQFGD